MTTDLSNNPNNEYRSFLCHWRIENYSFAYQSCEEHIASPIFMVDNLYNAKWVLYLYPRGFFANVLTVDCMLIGMHYTENELVHVQLELMTPSGATIAHLTRNARSTRHVTVFLVSLIDFIELRQRNVLGPEDYLILRCLMTRNDILPPWLSRRPRHSFCRIISEIGVEKDEYVWEIELLESREWRSVLMLKHTKQIKLLFCVLDSDVFIKLGNVGPPRFISCKISQIFVTKPEMILKETTRLFSNETWPFPGAIDLSVFKNSKNSGIKLKVDITYSTGSLSTTDQTGRKRSYLKAGYE